MLAGRCLGGGCALSFIDDRDFPERLRPAFARKIKSFPVCAIADGFPLSSDRHFDRARFVGESLGPGLSFATGKFISVEVCEDHRAHPIRRDIHRIHKDDLVGCDGAGNAWLFRSLRGNGHRVNFALAQFFADQVNSRSCGIHRTASQSCGPSS